MDPDFPLTPDIEWGMMRVHQQHLSSEYDNIRSILTLQERELALQSLMIAILIFVVVRQNQSIRHLLEEAEL